MKLLLTALFILCLTKTDGPPLTELRKYYQQAATQKTAADKLDQMVSLIDTAAAPAWVGYKGANEMIQAKYALSPITKLNRFNKGRTLLQLAIGKDTMNVETRFLRFCIQSNLPNFLNYDQDLNADKRFLISQTPHSKDDGLRNMIVNYFVSTHTLTAMELNLIKN